MHTTFIGNHELSLDAKGRIALPKVYRDALRMSDNEETPLVITAHPRGSLLVFALDFWQAICQKLASAGGFDKKVAQYRRMLAAYANQVSFDSHGRILLTASQKTLAQLDKKVQLVGNLTHMEIWSLERWHAINHDFSQLANDQEPPEILKDIPL